MKTAPGFAVVLLAAPLAHAADRYLEAQLTPEDMANVAAYFAALPGAEKGAKSGFLPNLAKPG